MANRIPTISITSLTLWTLFITPTAFVVSTRASYAPYILLGVIGFYTAVRDPRQVWLIFLSAPAVLLPFLLYLPYSLFSIAVQNGLLKTADNGLHFLWFTAVGLSFIHLRRQDIFWSGVSLASLLLGAIAIIQHTVLGIERVYGNFGYTLLRGTSGAIKFGMLSVLFCLLSLAAVIKHDPPQAQQRRGMTLCWHGISAAFALTGALLTQSRGPLLALILGALFILFFGRQRSHQKPLLSSLAALAVFVLALGGLFSSMLLDRLHQAVADWTNYASHGNVNTSVGARLAMWKAALQMFLVHPILGVGINQYGLELRRMIASGAADPAISIFNHTHNEYLEALACGGIVGALFLAWLFVAPFIFFARQWRFGPPANRPFALAGLVTVLSYAVFALTDNVFDRQMTVSLYAFLVLGCTVMCSAPMTINPTLQDKLRRAKRGRIEPGRAAGEGAKRDGISVVLITFNEARNIPTCLESVAELADEIIIVDSGSQDGTQAICRSFGATVIDAAWLGFGSQKNLALAAARCEWVLSLDADECLSPTLREQIIHAVACPRADIYALPRQSSYCGQWIRHSGWYPDYVRRLFRRSMARFSDDLVHERLIVAPYAICASLSAPLLHWPFRDFSDVLTKIDRYSTDGAQQAYMRGQGKEMQAKVRGGGLRLALLHGAWAFIRSYFIQRGFLDGKMGFILAVSNAQGTYYRYLKLMLLARQRPSKPNPNVSA